MSVLFPCPVPLPSKAHSTAVPLEVKDSLCFGDAYKVLGCGKELSTHKVVLMKTQKCIAWEGIHLLKESLVLYRQ